MVQKEMAPEEVRNALRRAERGIRVSYLQVALVAGLQALAIGFVLKVANFADPLHLLVVLVGALLFMQMFFFAIVFSARQDAVNARVLRALELLDERTS